jgi:hypothetical protein
MTLVPISGVVGNFAVRISTGKVGIATVPVHDDSCFSNSGGRVRWQDRF